MNKTKIEWVRNPDGTQGYSWNPIKGWCPNNCPYCYAHRMYTRFKWDKTIRFDEKELYKYDRIEKPSKIFVGSTIEMYHPGIPIDWIKRILYHSEVLQHHTIITLTKMPLVTICYHYPSWWWVGVTMDHFLMEYRAIALKAHRFIKGKKFISFEPLLSSMESVPLIGIDWIIIGGLTPKPVHKKEWIDDIVHRADILGIPVFIKSNAHYPIKRQDFPGGEL